MNKRISFYTILIVLAYCLAGCKDDVKSAGQAVLDDDDAVVVYADTFPIWSMMDSCEAIISQADSFLLGELESRYGLVRSSILTQLACPVGFSYPEGSVVDSICLFMYYSSWVGDANAPLAINAYLMDKGTFNYSGVYPTDLKIDDYCSRTKPVLTNRQIVVASEKMDSIANESGTYIPVVRMRVNDDFMDYFWAMKSFDSQEAFNKQFNGLLLETSFGSSTMLNISDIALGVYYHFPYSKAGKDTTVTDMKAFYANSEIRTVNHLDYPDKKEWIDELLNDSDTYNYIISPAYAYTRVTFPMESIVDSIMQHMVEEEGDLIIETKRPYVNRAYVRIDVTNKYTGSEADKTSADWLQPAQYMLLIKESSMKRFFTERELPSDTCALLSTLVQGTDSNGDAIYYYNYDMSDFLTNQLRKHTTDSELKMMLVPVTLVANSSGTAASAYSAVRQQQTMSATQIRSAKNGMKFEIVYSGFSIPSFTDED